MTDEEIRRQNHYRKMTESPVQRLIIKLAVPTIISMLVSSIYNMADTYFVSKLGTSAAGAVGVVFSVMAIIQAVGFTIGMGGGVIMSRQLGARETEKAMSSASTAFFFALALGILLAVFGVLFNKPLMRLLGATETILPYAQSYAAYIFLGAPFMCTSFVMNNLLRSEGKAAFAMVGITAGGVLNIALDPLFIFLALLCQIRRISARQVCVAKVDIHFGKQVMIHVRPVRIRIIFRKTDVLIQIERTAERKIQLTFSVHVRKNRIEILHGSSGCQSERGIGFPADLRGNQTGGKQRGLPFIGHDNHFHGSGPPLLRRCRTSSVPNSTS